MIFYLSTSKHTYKSPIIHMFMHPKLHFGITKTDQTNLFSTNNKKMQNPKKRILFYRHTTGWGKKKVTQHILKKQPKYVLYSYFYF